VHIASWIVCVGRREPERWIKSQHNTIDDPMDHAKDLTFPKAPFPTLRKRKK
jgi:hypothetical protein